MQPDLLSVQFISRKGFALRAITYLLWEKQQTAITTVLKGCKAPNSLLALSLSTSLSIEATLRVKHLQASTFLTLFRSSRCGRAIAIDGFQRKID
ncbi:hypothetical protein L1887_26099 [Cichorium endivia]|nr:hypothetical protein L1887_26099 [Cichorium endivia]